MTDTSSATDCTVNCSPKGSSDLPCACAGATKTRKTKTAKYLAGFVTLCAICCAAPPVLVALGLIGFASGAYLGTGLEVALIAFAVLGIGYLLMKYIKKKR